MSQPRRVFIFCSVFIVLFLSPWLLILSLNIYGKFDVWRYQQTTDFSDSRWKKPDLKYRYSVLNEVIAHQLRPAMTSAEVKSLLGEPDSFAEGGWQYEARRPGWHFIDWQGGGLLIRFSDQNMVVSVEKNHWTD